MSLFSTLRTDHDEVKGLLSEILNTTERSIEKRKELLDTLKNALVPHARAEEKVLYASLLQKHSEAEALANEGYEEHRLVDMLLNELDALDPSDKRWRAKFSVLSENLKHHIREEEGEIFEKARAKFSNEALEAMDQEFHALKEAFALSLPSQEETDARVPGVELPARKAV